jgi:hypothetical protein
MLCEFLPPKATIDSDKYCETGKIVQSYWTKETRMINSWSEASAWWNMASHFSLYNGLVPEAEMGISASSAT